MPDNYISTQTEQGSICISEDVIAAIAADAIAEVDGVAVMSASAGAALGELIGGRNAVKGIRVSFPENTVTVDAAILVHQGKNITAVAQQVQQSVSAALESVTGLKSAVNIHVNGVAFDK